MKVNVRFVFPVSKPSPLGLLHQSADLDRQRLGQSRCAQRGSNPSVRVFGAKLDHGALRQYAKGRDHQPMPGFKKTAGGSQLLSLSRKVRGLLRPAARMVPAP
jgi:hypothetical protein